MPLQLLLQLVEMAAGAAAHLAAAAGAALRPHCSGYVATEAGRQVHCPLQRQELASVPSVGAKGPDLISAAEEETEAPGRTWPRS